MAIRFDGELNSKINRVVAQFNKKVKYLESQGNKYLPDTITVHELKYSFRTRRELNRELERLLAFNKKGAEEIIKTKGGARMTRWERENLPRQLRVAQYRLNKQIKQEMANETNLRGSVSASITLDVLRANRSRLAQGIESLTQAKYQTFRKTIDITTKDFLKKRKFQESYTNAIIQMVAYQNDFDKDKLEIIKKELMSMSPDKFYDELYKKSASLQDIMSLYENLTVNAFQVKDNDDWLQVIQDVASGKKYAPSVNDSNNSLNNIFTILTQ